MKTNVSILAKDISRLDPSELRELETALMGHDIVATLYKFRTIPIGIGGREFKEYDVIMTRSGMRKLLVVKTIKEILGLGLKEAKELTDSVPSTLIESTTWEKAETLRISLEATGAKIEIISCDE